MRDILPGDEMLIYPADPVCRMDAPDFSKLDDQGQFKCLHFIFFLFDLMSNNNYLLFSVNSW